MRNEDDYMKDHIFDHELRRYVRLYSTNSKLHQLSNGLIAQLAKHSTGIAAVMGSNPVQA